MTRTSGIRMIRGRGILAALILGLIGNGCASATSRAPQTGTPLAVASRAELEARSADLERQLTAQALSGERRREAEQELVRLGQRLRAGDVRLGDQLVISMTGDIARSDTATVRDQLMVTFGGLPDVGLSGTLHSELRDRLQAHADRFYKNVTVRVSETTRLAILGEVARPGFYSIAPDRPIFEIIALAGGPTPLTNISKVTVRRDGKTILSVKDWERARRSGTTVAELTIQSGDEVEVGKRRNIPWASILQAAFLTLAATATLLQLLLLAYQNE